MLTRWARSLIALGVVACSNSGEDPAASTARPTDGTDAPNSDAPSSDVQNCSDGDTRVCVGSGACEGGQRCEEGEWGECDCGDGGGAGEASLGEEPSSGVTVAPNGSNTPQPSSGTTGASAPPSGSQGIGGDFGEPGFGGMGGGAGATQAGTGSAGGTGTAGGDCGDTATYVGAICEQYCGPECFECVTDSMCSGVACNHGTCGTSCAGTLDCPPDAVCAAGFCTGMPFCKTASYGGYDRIAELPRVSPVEYRSNTLLAWCANDVPTAPGFSVDTGIFLDLAIWTDLGLQGVLDAFVRVEKGLSNPVVGFRVVIHDANDVVYDAPAEFNLEQGDYTSSITVREHGVVDTGDSFELRVSLLNLAQIDAFAVYLESEGKRVYFTRPQSEELAADICTNPHCSMR